MRSISALFFLLGFVFTAAAQNIIYNDPGLQLRITGNGFSVQKAFIATDTALQNTNKLEYDTKYYMVISGIEGFKQKKNRVFPGIRIYVSDLGNKVIFDSGDLLADKKEGVDTSEVREIAPNIFTADPMTGDGFYVFNVEVWDKKGKARMHAAYTFALNPYDYEYTQKSEGLKARNLFVFQEGRLTFANRIRVNQQADYVFYGTGVFQAVNDKFYPGCRIRVIDPANQVLFESDDLYTNMVIDNGPDGALGDLKVFFTPSDDLEPEKPYKLAILFWDKKSDKKVEIEVPFIVYK